MRFLSQIPNALTLLRALATPVAIYFLVARNFPVALCVYIALALSDLLDGYLARKWKAVSSVGAVLDQVCDKMVGVGFFTALMLLGACPAWFGGLIISITVLQTLGYIIHHLPGQGPRVPLASLRIGKWNMALQYLWIGFDIALQMVPRQSAFFNLFQRVELVSYVALGTLQIAVFFRYFQYYRFHPFFDLRGLLARR